MPSIDATSELAAAFPRLQLLRQIAFCDAARRGDHGFQVAAKAAQDAMTEQGRQRDRNQRPDETDDEHQEDVFLVATLGDLRGRGDAVGCRLADRSEGFGQCGNQRRVGVAQRSVDLVRVLGHPRFVPSEHLVVQLVQLLGQPTDFAKPLAGVEAGLPLQGFERVDPFPEIVAAGEKLGLSLVEFACHEIAQQHAVQAVLLPLKGILRATHQRERLRAAGHVAGHLANIAAKGVEREKRSRQYQDAESRTDADHQQQTQSDRQGVK